MPYDRVIPVLDPKVRGLCSRPYEGHPRGCPNFRKAARCPPAAPHLDEVCDLGAPFYAVWSTFALGEHVAKMRERHPGWSDRQLRCVLYWQGTARRRLRDEVEAFRRERPEVDWLVEATPEAMGLEVTKTMAQVGVVLPWPPVELVYHVALAGKRRELYLKYEGRVLPVGHEQAGRPFPKVGDVIETCAFGERASDFSPRSVLSLTDNGDPVVDPGDGSRVVLEDPLAWRLL